MIDNEKPFEFGQIGGGARGNNGDDELRQALMQQGNAALDIPVTVSVVLGKTRMPVSRLLQLGRGAIVELDRKVGELVDIYANDRLIARGEIMIVGDQRLGVTMNEIVRSEGNRG